MDGRVQFLIILLTAEIAHIIIRLLLRFLMRSFSWSCDHKLITPFQMLLNQESL